MKKGEGSHASVRGNLTIKQGKRALSGTGQEKLKKGDKEKWLTLEKGKGEKTRGEGARGGVTGPL